MEIHPRTKTLATELLTRLEGCETTAYLDPVGVPTICTGLTRYPNGEPVRLEDVCHEDICGKYTEQLICLLYTSPSPRDGLLSRMPSSA